MLKMKYHFFNYFFYDLNTLLQITPLENQYKSETGGWASERRTWAAGRRLARLTSVHKLPVRLRIHDGVTP